MPQNYFFSIFCVRNTIKVNSLQFVPYCIFGLEPFDNFNVYRQTE